MKYLVVCILAVAVFQITPADAFLSSLVNGLSNIVGSVVDTVNNGVNTVINTVSSGIDSVTNTINTVTLVGQFLWDNSLNPALTVLQQNGVDFIDNYFGNVLNLLGKRGNEVESTMILKQEIKSAYISKTTDLIQSLKLTVADFLNEAALLLKSSTLAIISGQTTIKEILTELVKKYKFKIDTLIQNVKQDILETLKPLMFARVTGLELLAAQVGNTVLAIGNLTNASINALLSTIFAQIAGK